MMELDVLRAVVAILVGIATLNGLMLWAVKVLIGRHQHSIDEALQQRDAANKDRDQKQDARLLQMERQIGGMELRLSEKFMRREDYVQSFGRMEQKIDAIWEYIRVRMLTPKTARGEKPQ